MELYIVIFNVLSAVAVATSISIVLYRFFKFKTNYQLLFALALIIILIGSVINILQHADIIDTAEEFEQIFSVLFLPILIFAILESILRKEIQVRKRSEQKFKGIFNQTFSFIGLLDREGRILDANKTAIEFAGYKDKAFLGEYFYNTKWWSDAHEEEVQKLKNAIAIAQSGKMARMETHHPGADGSIRYVDFSLTPVMDERGEVIFLIPEGRDITEMRQTKLELEMHKNHLEKLVSDKTHDLEIAYEELQATNEELYDKNKIIHEQNEELMSTLQYLKETQSQLLHSDKMASLGVLTAGVAHEINNPLNFIMGAYLGLSRHFENSTSLENREQIKGLLDALKVGVERSSAIVRGLNQFSRRSDSLIEDCDIHAIIDNSLTMLRNQTIHHITIDKQYCEKEVIIKGNVGNLHQVFINILSNSIQSITSKGTITIKTEREKSEVVIIISDSGNGISEEHLDKITEPFFTTKEPGKGTGLGLSITYNIIKEHKGKLEFSSELGKGTSVKIVLPLNVQPQ